MSQNIELPPIRNGLDYLQSAIEHLQGQPSVPDLKYAVLHLQAAVEVLLKVRLIREHWALVFLNPDKASRGDFSSGNFISTGLEETLTRLKGIVAINLTAAAQDSFKKLAKERNKLQHFGMADRSKAFVEDLTGKVLDALLSFVVEHLRPGADQNELELLDDTQELIRKEMARIRILARARWDRIKPDLDSCAARVIHCPDCGELALLLDGSARCLFCDHEWENGNDAAEEYAASVLGITWYDVKDGAEAPVYICPDCGAEAFIADVVIRLDPTNPRYVCVSCGMNAEQDAIGKCVECGEHMRYDEERNIICPSCWTSLIDRD